MRLEAHEWVLLSLMVIFAAIAGGCLAAIALA
jgi:hypothetical protein